MFEFAEAQKPSYGKKTMQRVFEERKEREKAFSKLQNSVAEFLLTHADEAEPQPKEDKAHKQKPQALKPLQESPHAEHHKTQHKTEADLVHRMAKVLKQNVMHQGDSQDSSHGQRSVPAKKKHPNVDMSEVDTIDTLSKIYNSKNAYLPID